MKFAEPAALKMHKKALCTICVNGMVYCHNSLAFSKAVLGVHTWSGFVGPTVADESA